MADSRAFTYFIDAKGYGKDETDTVDGQTFGLINQSSPAWVLTFVPWENRDTFRDKSDSFTSVRPPIVVENDCLYVNTVQNKGTLTPSLNATLVMTDVNYETAVAPGDFVFVNILNWQSEAKRVAQQARNQTSINGTDDGFKGIYKVQSVRRVLTTDPNTGTKFVLFKITGFAFTEFNNSIYFNPYLIDPGQDQQNQLLFASLLGQDWSHLVNKKAFNNVQDLIAILIQSFIGTGVANAEAKIFKQSAVRSKNTHFFIPSLVGNLLGVKGAKAAKDIYNYVFGIQSYAAGSSSTSLAVGMNPTIGSVNYGRFYYTGTPCEGNSLLKPEYWNQVKAWSILNQYTNSPLNELYTCFRVATNGQVMPTVVFRQIPFTTEDYTGPGTITKFMNLPRWKISTALITDLDIGRDESARVNFMQYFGKSNLGVAGADISVEIAQKNYMYDIDDVQRSGLRPYIVTTQFDDPTDSYKAYRSPKWAQIVGNAVIGGHLKLNGTITCMGIVPPIAVGDNLELDNVVYHIEQVSHTANYGIQDGKATFRTTISLSSGVSISSSTVGTRYAQMTNTNAYSERDADSQYNKILPGISESQDVAYRTSKNPEPSADELKGKNNAPFPQPARKNKSGGGTNNNGQNG